MEFRPTLLLDGSTKTQEQGAGPNLGSTGGSLRNILERGKQQYPGGAGTFGQAEGRGLSDRVGEAGDAAQWWGA